MNQSAPVSANLNEIAFVTARSAAGKDPKLDDQGAGEIHSKYNKKSAMLSISMYLSGLYSILESFSTGCF